MGGNRTCPDDCFVGKWASLAPLEKKRARKFFAHKLLRHGLSQKEVAVFFSWPGFASRPERGHA